MLGPIGELIRATNDARGLDSLVIKAYELVSYTNKIDLVAVSGFFKSARLQDVQKAMGSADQETRADFFSELKTNAFTAKAKGIRQKYYA